jgi:hypothetical protein
MHHSIEGDRGWRTAPARGPVLSFQLERCAAACSGPRQTAGGALEARVAMYRDHLPGVLSLVSDLLAESAVGRSRPLRRAFSQFSPRAQLATWQRGQPAAGAGQLSWGPRAAAAPPTCSFRRAYNLGSPVRTRGRAQERRNVPRLLRAWLNGRRELSRVRRPA